MAKSEASKSKSKDKGAKSQTPGSIRKSTREKPAREHFQASDSKPRAPKQPEGGLEVYKERKPVPKKNKRGQLE